MLRMPSKIRAPLRIAEIVEGVVFLGKTALGRVDFLTATLILL
jgi:hypothetical protein